MEGFDLDRIVDLLFEVGILAKLPRSGFAFLGSGDQSIAEHTARTAFIGYVLAMLEGDVDTEKTLKMCLFHDLPEARTSDLNNVSKRYTQADVQRAVGDLVYGLQFGEEIHKLLEEFEAGQTKEAVLARDADQLELLLSLKEQLDLGNRKAERWIPYVLDNLKTKTSKELAEAILKADSDRWWFPKEN